MSATPEVLWTTEELVRAEFRHHRRQLHPRIDASALQTCKVISDLGDDLDPRTPHTRAHYPTPGRFDPMTEAFTHG